ncbi:bifunctional 4-hydroxy-2-oxoglutarate aldolase/2-dehydro-3-deoxy-phosphogluconate aldolase [Siminovitchia sp. 179-K 8D1 HS]|uniref:bifunctional 4-hydroxy-2-oxoglutarate aldolase/2-dehydro-3-deoxy-phosphogluconate aldolase n=1 Tax=Siminovitchia sp. 179-K 8D1 HS TaxID=3142385 RepID=UPI0039A2C010
MNVLEKIKEQKIVAVIRSVKDKDIDSIADALLAGGVNILEITAESPNFISSIKRVKEVFGDKITVGAGTVLDPETASLAIKAGAQFIFSPTVNFDTIKMTKRYGVVSIPGAMTPTEVINAYEQGADIIKIFPANVLGPKYLKDIHGPLPHIPLMPTGGINLSNVQEYLLNGAVAVGIGSTLVNTKTKLSDSNLKEITEKATKFVRKVTELKEQANITAFI